MDEWESYPRVAVATAMQAQKEGCARTPKPRDELLDQATRVISEARRLAQVLSEEGLIAEPPTYPLSEKNREAP